MLLNKSVVDQTIVTESAAEPIEILEYVLQNVSDGVAIFDRHYCLVSSNEAFQRMLGYSAKSIQMTTLADFDPQFSRTQNITEQNNSRFSYFINKGVPSHTQFVKRDKSIITVQASATITLLKGEQVALVIVKAANKEDELAAELREFKSIVDKTTDCVFIFSQDSLNFTYINRGAEKQVGYSLEQLERMHPYDLKPEFSEDEFRNLISPLIRNGGGTLNFDTVHQHKNGDLIDVSIILQLVQGHSGEKQFVAIVRDISDYKKLQEKYGRSQKMEAMGRFAGGVAHDFDNQLSVIQGYADLLTHQDMNDNAQEYAKRIVETASVSKKLVEQLLVFSRNDKLKLSTLDIHEVIREAEDFLLDTTDNTLTLSLNLTSSAYRVAADRSSIKTAILNLALNSRDAMPNGGHIFIETDRLPYTEIKPGVFSEAIQITLSDTGCGIPASRLPSIFDSCSSQVTNEIDRGEGLSSVKYTIEQHGGSINADNNIGEGVVFTIVLPVVKANRS